MRKKPLPLSTCLAAVWRKVRQRRQRRDRAPRSAITFHKLIFAGFRNPGKPLKKIIIIKEIRKKNFLQKSSGSLLKTRKGGKKKSSKSSNVKEHLEPGTFKTGRMKHEAGEEPQVRDRILNLVEAEVGEGKKNHRGINPWPPTRGTWAKTGAARRL